MGEPDKPDVAEHNERVARAFRHAGWRLRIGRRVAVDWLIRLISLVATVAALLFAAHIVFVVFHGNPANEIVKWINARAADLALGMKTLFTPRNVKLAATANYAIAAVVYLVAAKIVNSLLRHVR